MIKTEYYKDLTKMNTFGMKVKARCFMEYDSVADLVDIEFEELARPVLHIGGGSNLLFTDDFKGTVLHSRINFIEILDECHGTSSEKGRVLVSVGSGVVFDDFCAWAAKEGLWGVENLSHIPGEVGASAVQNIGAYGVEVKDVIHKVYCYDTVEEEFVNFSVEECEYGYRDSIFKDPEIKGKYIVTHVVFALSREPRPRLEYGHLKEAVISAYGECQSVPEAHSQASLGPSPSPVNHPRNPQIFGDPEKVGKCLFHTNGTSPENGDASIERHLTPEMIRRVIIKIRKEKLPEPSVMGSAGSFFKNPVITMEHYLRIEAAAKAEHGPDYNVPHYIIEDPTVTPPALPTDTPPVLPTVAPPVISSDTAHCHFERPEGVEKSPMVKVPAAWIIEQCGWKGRRSGGAAVYDKQPLVIVNYTGEAYPEEIIGLERRIIASVKAKFGVDLHPEVEHI